MIDLFNGLLIFIIIAGAFAVLSIVAAFFEWATKWLNRKMDEMIWTDHD